MSREALHNVMFILIVLIFVGMITLCVLVVKQRAGCRENIQKMKDDIGKLQVANGSYRQ